MRVTTRPPSCSRAATPSSPTLRTRLPEDAVVIAADSGLHQARRSLGLHVDCVVGDLDSADPAAVERGPRRGADVERHPAEKDATDLELAFDCARDRGAQRITVVGGAGGRLDHFLANVALLGVAAVRRSARSRRTLGDGYARGRAAAARRRS